MAQCFVWIRLLIYWLTGWSPKTYPEFAGATGATRSASEGRCSQPSLALRRFGLRTNCTPTIFSGNAGSKISDDGTPASLDGLLTKPTVLGCRRGCYHRLRSDRRELSPHERVQSA